VKEAECAAAAQLPLAVAVELRGVDFVELRGLAVDCEGDSGVQRATNKTLRHAAARQGRGQRLDDDQRIVNFGVLRELELLSGEAAQLEVVGLLVPVNPDNDCVHARLELSLDAAALLVAEDSLPHVLLQAQAVQYNSDGREGVDRVAAKGFLAELVDAEVGLGGLHHREVLHLKLAQVLSHRELRAK